MDVHDVIIIDEHDQEVRAPHLDAYDTICRVCLSDDGANQRNIHELESQMTVRSLIEVYTYVKIPEFEDNLPQNICHKCMDFLIDVHMFRSRCRLNEDLLHKVYEQAVDQEMFNQRMGKAAGDASAWTDQTQAMINRINDQRMGIFRCKDCPAVHASRKALLAHRAEAKHSRRPGSKCPHCGKLFTTTGLIQHLRTHTKEKPFACVTCGAAFAIKTNLRRHMKTHAQGRSYTCEVCGKSFLRSETLANHLKMHRLEKIKMENADGDAGGADVELHECAICHKFYASAEQLKTHMRYHRRSFLCNTCGKVFATKANLVTHVRVHTGERPFICEVCNKGFTQISSMKTHQVIHSGDKAHVCHVCNRRFSVKGNLMVHMRTHTGETPHRCSVCDKGFCTSSTLRKHMQMHAKREDTLDGVDADEAAEEDERTAPPGGQPAQVEEGATDSDVESRMKQDDMADTDGAYTVHAEEEIIIEEYVDEDGEQVFAEEIQVVYDGIAEEVEYESDAQIEYDAYEPKSNLNQLKV